MKQLETVRLFLREPMADDAKALLAIRNSDFVQRYNAMRIIDEGRLRRQIVKDLTEKTALYLVLKEENRLIGGIWFDEDDKRYEIKSRYISFYLAEQYAQKGYMKEALSAVVDFLFENDPALEVLSSSTFSDNIASENLVRSVGFTYEGCIRRCVRDPRGNVHDDKQFSLLREEWLTKKNGGII